jgi:hypothetical protein
MSSMSSPIGGATSATAARSRWAVTKTMEGVFDCSSSLDLAGSRQNPRAIRMYRATRRAAAHEWLEGAESGVIRNRSGDMYKPSVIRGYDEALRLRVLPAIGAHKLADIAARDVQDLIDRWQAEGLSASASLRVGGGERRGPNDRVMPPGRFYARAELALQRSRGPKTPVTPTYSRRVIELDVASTKPGPEDPGDWPPHRVGVLPRHASTKPGPEDPGDDEPAVEVAPRRALQRSRGPKTPVTCTR